MGCTQSILKVGGTCYPNTFFVGVESWKGYVVWTDSEKNTSSMGYEGKKIEKTVQKQINVNTNPDVVILWDRGKNAKWCVIGAVKISEAFES